MTYALSGLPPTSEELAAYEKDASPDAYQKVVDRLLAAPRYGEHMARYRHTFLHLWRNEARFHEAWLASHGVCLRHLAGLMESAEHRLSPAQQAQFANEALTHLTRQCEADAADLDWFTRKFDYRNQDAPWGESKTALERLVNRLRGWCLGDEPWPKGK